MAYFDVLKLMLWKHKVNAIKLIRKHSKRFMKHKNCINFLLHFKFYRVQNMLILSKMYPIKFKIYNTAFIEQYVVN